MYSLSLINGRRLGIVALSVAMMGSAWGQRTAIAQIVLFNPGFEDEAVLNQEPLPSAIGWLLQNRGDKNTVSAPNFPTHSGIGSLQLARTAGDIGNFGVPIAHQDFPALPGQAFDLQAYLRVDQAFTGATRALIKITFHDFENPLVDLQPASVTFGMPDPDAGFPGIIPTTQVTSATPTGQWILQRVGGVAPAGTDQVSFFGILVDATPGTVYFDDFVAALVEPSVVGDFDDDLDVDTTDFNTWKAAFGQTAAGDADGDNDSDGKDFLLWQANFGTLPGATAAAGSVPEPASASLAVAALGLLAARRGRRA